jgi:hypothetical protein
MLSKFNQNCYSKVCSQCPSGLVWRPSKIEFPQSSCQGRRQNTFPLLHCILQSVQKRFCPTGAEKEVVSEI